MNEDESLENDPDLVPVKDEGYYIPGDYVPNFHHDRLIVGKMSREDLEDRYLITFEDNFKLKKVNKEQEDKIKKLATKLIRVLSDKKRIEMGSRTGLVTSPSSGRLKDPETENFIEDQNQRIRELEKENSHLRDKFQVAKTQLLSLQPNYSPSSLSTYRPKRFPSPKPNSCMMYNVPSTSPLYMSNPQQANGNNNLNQQAHRLLEEARNENRMLEETIMTLKERVAIFEQEVDLVREQSKIKESNLEDEISHLKSEMSSEGLRDKVNENVEIMKLQREVKTGNTRIKGYEAQIQALEVEYEKFKASSEKNRREAVDLSAQLQEEQKKALSSNNEKSSSLILKQTIKELEEKINDLKKENLILREHNERLLNSAFDLERERQYQATENSLKLKIAQLESTMKNDLNDKKSLSDSLEKEREAYSKLEVEFEDVRSKFYKLKQLTEENDEGPKESSAQDSPFDPREVEKALLYLRQKKDQISTGYPSFMTEIDNKKDFNIAELKKEISEIQVQYLDTVNELEKTRELLRIQNSINTEQKKEIESLHKRITGVKNEYLTQISEFKKLLDMRANRILKLENQVRENAYVSVRSNYRQQSRTQCSSFMYSNEVSLHTPSGQSLFEIHISKVSLIPNAVTALNDEHLNIFATWCFYDNDMQYSPVIQGPEASLDCSSYYKVKLKDEFLEYLKEGYMVVEVHLATDEESNEDGSCRTIGSARINLSQVLEYPSNKLHGSVMVYSTSGARETSNILGTLDFWFKLHTAATNRIVQWLEHKNETERNMRISESNMRKSNENILEEVDLYSGESADIEDNSLHVRSRPPRSLPNEPKPAPRVSKTLQKSPENQTTPQPSPRKRRSSLPKSTRSPSPRPIPRQPSNIAQTEIRKKKERNSLETVSISTPSPKFSPSIDSSSSESESDTSFELNPSPNMDVPPKEPIQVLSQNTEPEFRDRLSDDKIVDVHKSKEESEEEILSDEEIDEETTSYESEYSESIDSSSSISDDETKEEIIQKQVTISSQETIINNSDKIEGEDEEMMAEGVEEEDEPKKKKKGIFATLFGRKKFKNEDAKDHSSDNKKKEEDSKKKNKRLDKKQEESQEEEEDSQSDSEDEEEIKSKQGK